MPNWPTTVQFSEAIQHPGTCFTEPQLAGGQVVTNSMGLPAVYSGNFACVYQVKRPDQQESAVRCFTREVGDQKTRYGHLSDHLNDVILDSFVNFQYLEEGIMVGGKWYPVVMMDWAQGEPLNRYVGNAVRDGQAARLREMAARWRGAVGGLHGVRIAHNDLQHGNVLVSSDHRIKLVDYDGIFLPQFQGEKSPEIGHKNYQHPGRGPEHYNNEIDNFPALVVYLSLLALSSDPSMWEKFHNDDNLVLTRRDFQDPQHSKCFADLQGNSDQRVRKLAGQLAELCAAPVEQTPPLESILAGVSNNSVQSTQTRPSADYRELLRQGGNQGGNTRPILCPRCSWVNEADLIFCTNCLAPLSKNTLPCPCGTQIPDNAVYCHRCGRENCRP